MALKKVRGNFDRLFEKNLSDLVRGIRSNKENEAKYIQQCIEEIKDELKQGSPVVKANAIAKISYLQMLGYDMSWAAFNVIEVMSSARFTHKRIGYLGASQSFHDDTEVLMLATNLIRKDINSHNQYDAEVLEPLMHSRALRKKYFLWTDTGVALSSVACFVTEDLSRDLTQDIINLMSSTRPYLRKKAVLMSYKVFLKYPDALRIAFPKLKEKLEDPDPGVQSATVNVICELARHNPKNYITLAPTFFKLMTTSSNNWMLIKIIKLLAALVPLEPRLGKKLIEPLTTLIHSTSAMSLLYECINTVIAVLLTVSAEVPNRNAAVNLCVQKLRILIEDADQNLKYLGLLAMSRILQAHPKSVSAHKDIILTCLDDRDESIRLRALDLLYGMVNKKNLMDIVRKLMDHMQKAEGTHYRDQLLVKVIDVCSQNGYQYVTDFEWYISVLVDLTRIYGTHHGELIASQLLDVAVRVQSIRHFAVQQMALLLENTQLLLSSTVEGKTIQEVLLAAAFICGEYSEHLITPQNCLQSMFQPKVTTLAAHIQIVYVQSIAKLYACSLLDAERDDLNDAGALQQQSLYNGNQENAVNGVSDAANSNSSSSKVDKLNSLMLDKLPMFVQSPDLEVQERACSFMELVKVVQELRRQQPPHPPAQMIALLFAGELNPVAVKAQRKVPLPEGLNLDAWINDPPSDTDEEEEDNDDLVNDAEQIHNNNGAVNGRDFGVRPTSLHTTKQQQQYEPTEEELRERRHQRLAEQAQNPHYLKSSSSPSSSSMAASKQLAGNNRRSSNDPSQGPNSSTGLTAIGSSRQRARAAPAGNLPSSNVGTTTPLDEIPGLISTDKYLQQQRSTVKPGVRPRGGKKHSKRSGAGGAVLSEDENEEPTLRHVVNTAVGEEPEGAKSTDEDEDARRRGADPYKALDIDLDEILRSHNEQRRRFQQQDESYYADMQRREQHADGFGSSRKAAAAATAGKPSEIYIDSDFYRRKPVSSSNKVSGKKKPSTSASGDAALTEQREKRVKKKVKSKKSAETDDIAGDPNAVKEKKVKKTKKAAETNNDAASSSSKPKRSKKLITESNATSAAVDDNNHGDSVEVAQQPKVVKKPKKLPVIGNVEKDSGATLAAGDNDVVDSSTRKKSKKVGAKKSTTKKTAENENAVDETTN